MHDASAPQFLKNAREEILMALASNDATDAADHRTRANTLIKNAVGAIQREPEHLWDWSKLRSPAQSGER
jgi:hypothetical protein